MLLEICVIFCASFFICCHTFPSTQAPERTSHQVPQRLRCLSRWRRQAGALTGEFHCFLLVFSKLNLGALHHAVEEQRLYIPNTECRVLN